MSRSTVYEIKFGKELVELAEFANGHGCAPVIWDALCGKYLGDPFAWIMSKKGSEDLWKLAENKNIPEYQRAVLIMTFDHAFLDQSNFSRAAADIRRFQKEFPPKSGYVNHWPNIAQMLDTLKAKNFGIYHTSVSENPFYNYGPQGGAKVKKRSECYEVYEYLKDENDREV
jgi:hypothetical protein